ncbi:MAG: hypothetical protein R3Y26_01365 [Rikenellaceae bacterium]
MKKILYALVATAFAISCSEFEIYETPYPDSATVNINVEWTTLHDGDAAPTEYAILNNGTEQKVSEETTYILEPTADNDFLVYNFPSGITISNGVATLNEATRVASDPEPNPGHLYYGTVSVALVADNEQDIKVVTCRGTAPLTINLSYDKDYIANISSAIVELSGIATSRNLLTGLLTDESTLFQYPTLDDSGTLTLSYNIFGTIGSAQELTITFITVDNQTMTVTSDLSTLFSTFNDNMETLILTGDLNLPINIEANGSINNWGNGSGGTVTAK